MATANAQRRAVVDAYRVWAPDYDERPNPVTALVGRVLNAILPPLSGKVVVDLGCGTGGSFALLENAASVIGIDISPEMLARAQARNAANVRLLQADVTHLPLPEAGADLVIASMLFGYLPELESLARQIRRICREDGKVIVTDLHATTARIFDWKRRATTAHGRLDLPARCVDVAEVIGVMSRAGFSLEMQLEVPFGAPEATCFEQTGRRAEFDRLGRSPAIFALQFCKAPPESSPRGLALRGCRTVLDGSLAVNTDLQFASGKVAQIGMHSGAVAEVELSGMTVFPGLINAHDHLEFALFPRMGDRIYRCAGDWAASIHRNYARSIHLHRKLDRGVRYTWGAIRNLLAGATSVCHHNALNETMTAPEFPVKVLREFSWSHSLEFDPALRQRHERADQRHPFVLHAGEGCDDEARREFDQLLRLGILDDRTVVVHGLAFEPDELRTLAARGSSLIWCPSSNVYLFGTTHDPETLAEFPRVALGSDSPLTAEGDLLDEIRFASRALGASSESLFRQVTTGAAGVLHMRAGEGSLRPGGPADCFAVKNECEIPGDRLAELSFRDIEMVFRSGVLEAASTEALDRLPAEMRNGMSPIEIDGTVRWLRQPLGKLFASTESVLGLDFQMMRRTVRHVASRWI